MTSLEYKYVKQARQSHRCSWCQEVIQKGEGYYKNIYINDGAFNADKVCNDCNDHLNNCDECRYLAQYGELDLDGLMECKAMAKEALAKAEGS